MDLEIVVPPDRLDEFWKGVYPQGMTIQNVTDELHDFGFMIEEVPKVYCHVSGGRISKPNTYGSEVIGEHDRQRQEDIEEAIKEAREEWEDEKSPVSATDNQT